MGSFRGAHSWHNKEPAKASRKTKQEMKRRKLSTPRWLWQVLSSERRRGIQARTRNIIRQRGQSRGVQPQDAAVFEMKRNCAPFASTDLVPITAGDADICARNTVLPPNTG